MSRVEWIAVVGSLVLLGLIVELIRQRKLAENYALLWLLTGIILFVLSLWRELLDVLADLVGIFYPPAALFVIGFGFVILILLQFSVVITKRAREHKELIQTIGLLEWKLNQLEDLIKDEHSSKQ